MHFGFALELSDIDLWNTDLLDTHLDLLSRDRHTDIPSKYFACLHKIFKRSSRHIFKTSSRHVFKTSSTRLGRRKIVTLKTCCQGKQIFAGEIVDNNSDEPALYPFSTKTSKCGGSCNNIDYPYAKMCVLDVIKNVNVGVFNLMSRTNETRHIKWHETCKWTCRLHASVCLW